MRPIMVTGYSRDAGAEKTNAMRLLDAAHIAYEVFEFSPELHSVADIAPIIGVPADHVFKTLVAVAPTKRPLLVMVPGDRELDLKLVAAAVGVRKTRMASQREAETLTGLRVGGISALALLNRGFGVYLDRGAQGLPFVVVSAGRRGTNLRLSVDDLVRVTGARLIDATLLPGGDDSRFRDGRTGPI